PVLQANAMLKGIFDEWNQQHRSDVLVSYHIFYFSLDRDVGGIRSTQQLQVKVVAHVLDLTGKQYFLLVVFVQHKAHHVAQHLYTLCGALAILLQGRSVERVQRVEQKVRVDLGAQEIEVSAGGAQLFFQHKHLLFAFHLAFVDQPDNRARYQELEHRVHKADFESAIFTVQGHHQQQENRYVRHNL